jgi:hypothetical protein
MTQVLFSPILNGQVVLDNNGKALAGGKIFTYANNTANSEITFSALDGAPNTNPIILDSSGRLPSELWLVEGVMYTIIIAKANGTVLQEINNVKGISSLSSGTDAENTLWVKHVDAPNYISPTSIMVPGLVSSVFRVGNRIKFVQDEGSSSLGATVTSVSISAENNTVVTFSVDEGTLNSNVAEVWVSSANTEVLTIDSGAITWNPELPFINFSLGAKVKSLDAEVKALQSAPAVQITNLLPPQSNNATFTLATDGSSLYWKAPTVTRATYFSIMTSDAAPSSREVYLTAGTWRMSIELKASDTDDLVSGNSNYTVQQQAQIDGVGAVSVTFGLYRQGGRGYGRRVFGSRQNVMNVTIPSDGTYTLRSLEGTATGEGSGNNTFLGTTVIVEKL